MAKKKTKFDFDPVISALGGRDNVMSVSATTDLMKITTKIKLTDEQVAALRAIPVWDDVSLKGPDLKLVPNDDIEFDDYGSQLTQTLTRNNANIKTKNVVGRVLDFVSQIFIPIIPMFAGSGILRGLLVLSTELHWLSANSSTYHILYAASNAVFYFLPILLAFSAGRAFKVDQISSAVIVAALMEPNIVNLLHHGATTGIAHFFTIPVVLQQYSSTVIPAFLAIWLYSYVEKGLKRIITPNLQVIFVPLLALVVVVPLVLIVVGPIGIYLGQGLAAVMAWLVKANSTITGAVIGGLWPVFVIFGLHWSILPIIWQNLASAGHDFIIPMAATSNFGIAGAAMGVLIRARMAKTRSLASSGLISLLVAGIGEPTIWGFAIPMRRPFIAACLGGATGGAVIGFFHVDGVAAVFGALTTLPGFATPTFIWYIVGISVAFIVSTLLTVIFGFDETELGVNK